MKMKVSVFKCEASGIVPLADISKWDIKTHEKIAKMLKDVE